MADELDSPVKIALITGYLGAGKTTLLNHILGNTDGIRAAVIVNDIGEVNIDAELIVQTGALTQMDDSLIPMTNGCICCSLSEDLAQQLVDIAVSGNFDYIIIEASGVCEPMPIAYTIQSFCEATIDDESGEESAPLLELDNIIAVVDSARMFDEFNGGHDLLDTSVEEDDIESLLISQIEFCSTLILNKADQVTTEQMEELHALIRNLQKKAKIIEAEKGQVDLKELLNTGLYDFNKIYDSAGWVSVLSGDEDDHDDDDDHEEHHHDHEEHDEHHHDHEEHDERDHDEREEHHHDHAHGHHHDHEHGEEHNHLAEFGISTFVYERRTPFAMPALNELVKNWPKEIIRCKGMMWVEEQNDVCFLFEQAGKQFYISDNGPWFVTASDEDREFIKESNPHVLDDFDEVIGDRRIKLVVIGKNMNQEQIENIFDSYLNS